MQIADFMLSASPSKRIANTAPLCSEKADNQRHHSAPAAKAGKHSSITLKSAAETPACIASFESIICGHYRKPKRGLCVMQPSQREMVVKELKRIRSTPSLSAIVRMTGVSRQTLLNITDGAYSPTETTVERLAPTLRQIAQTD